MFYAVDDCILVVVDRSISPELLEAFDAMLSAFAGQSQAGKEAVEKAGGSVLTRFVVLKYSVSRSKEFLQ